MCEPGDRRPREAEDQRVGGRRTPSFEEYAAARARFFERLRVEWEVQGLERSWRLPGPEGVRPGARGR